ncbi:hypothetical protein ASC63_01155 [Leifsonia sp. Root112D2]|nr:hypothetical protein ASC63_01155 [Leifsonia sp. Root112D2]
MLASQHGVIGNGIVDDSHALQSVLNTAAKLGATVVIDGGLRVRIGKTIAVPSNTKLNGGGSTLLNATPGTGGRILTLTKVHDVTIDYINFDGEKDTHVTATEQRHNLVVAGSRNITLDRMHSYNAKGDGLYIGDQISGASVNVNVSNSLFDENHRQGMSVTGVSGLSVTDCHFGTTAGTAPQSGADIEPNSDDSVMEDIVFRNCSFMGNLGSGLLISLRKTPTAKQSAGTYIGCQFSQNKGSSGIVLVNSRDLKILGGEIRRNDRDGVAIFSAENTSLSDVSVAGNGRAGVSTTWTFSDLTLKGCSFDGNGTAEKKTYFAIDCAPVKGNKASGLLVQNCKFKDMYGGIRTNAVTSRVTLTNNGFSDLKINKQLGDDKATRVDVGGTAIPEPRG